MNRSDVQKLIDACRSEADLGLPEFAPLAELIESDESVRNSWERSRRFDAAVRGAMRNVEDVRVPVGLDDRLLQMLLPEERSESQDRIFKKPDSAHGKIRDIPQTGGILVSPRSGSNSNDPASRTRHRVRRWGWIALAGSVAATLLITLVIWQGREPLLATEGDVVSSAAKWTGGLDDSAWRTDASPGGFPLPIHLRVRPVAWQRISQGTGSLSVVCYDLSNGGSKAWLFVTRTKQSPEIGSQPPSAVYSTQGQAWSFAAWKAPADKNNYVYVLAVSGGNRQYQQLISTQSGMVIAVPNGRRVSLAGKV